mgnify:CR=1 FL=1
MKSIKELYRIGTGPSSSHTMGPRKAAELFLEKHPEASSFKVTLYGSLAATGKGVKDNYSHNRYPATCRSGRNHLGTENIPAFSSQRDEVRFCRCSRQ